MFINYAHRGASEYYPENTMSAFDAGIRMGANGIETDVQRTRDGELVLFHDASLERVTGVSGMLADFTLEELSTMCVRSKDGTRSDVIPTLEGFLAGYGSLDITFAIELKADGVARDTIDLLERYHMREKVVLTSFSFENICEAKAYAPGYRVGLLYGEKEPDPVGKILSIGGEELCPHASLVTKELVDRYHAMGLNVRAWGVKDRDVMEHVVLCGADGMTVNFPDVLAAYLAQRA